MSRGRRSTKGGITYRSGLEKAIGGLLQASLLDFKHEEEKLRYIVPETKRLYNPDFQVKKYPKLIIEAKGIFSASDRKKMILIKEQHPDRQILMIFGRAKNPIRKGSKTTYSSWCDHNEIDWVDLEDFKKDPRACLSRLTKRQRSGKSPTSPQKKPRRSSKSGRKPSSTAKGGS